MKGQTVDHHASRLSHGIAFNIDTRMCIHLYIRPLVLEVLTRIDKVVIAPGGEDHASSGRGSFSSATRRGIGTLLAATILPRGGAFHTPSHQEASRTPRMIEHLVPALQVSVLRPY
jgi:hypothetical protein